MQQENLQSRNTLVPARETASVDVAPNLKAPIDIALCITELDVGGAERCLTQLAIRLDRKRFRPRVYCLGPRPKPNNSGSPSATAATLADQIEASGVPVTCFDARATSDAPRVLWQLMRELRRTRPQLIQSFLLHANLISRVAARLAGVPHVVSGIRVAERRGGWRLAADGWTAPLVERHVCVSRDVADYSITQGGLPAERCVVIPNGIDLAAFDHASPLDRAGINLAAVNLAGDTPFLLYVGRLDEQKRPLWLIERAAEFLPALAEPSDGKNYSLVIVGDGPQRSAAERRARELGVDHCVHFLGRRPHELVRSLLREAQLFLLPSAWEGMPNVVLEAMASRLPVVACDVEGLREVLGDAADAQLASPDDTTGFTRKVIELASDRELAQRLAHENRQRIEQHFSLDEMIRKYEALYEELCRRT